MTVKIAFLQVFKIAEFFQAEQARFFGSLLLGPRVRCVAVPGQRFALHHGGLLQVDDAGRRLRHRLPGASAGPDRGWLHGG